MYRRWLPVVGLLLTLLIIVFGLWLFRLDHDIAARFREKRFAPPVEFYTAPELIRPGFRVGRDEWEAAFNARHFRARPFVADGNLMPGDNIQPGDFSFWDKEQCLQLLNSGAPPEGLDHCVLFRNSIALSGWTKTDLQMLILAADDSVLSIGSGSPLAAAEVAALEPVLYAQFYGDKPTLRRVVNLAEAPYTCLQGLMAIEDSRFLEHSGISFTSLARAMLANLRHGRVAQGGSTITQQLVKNYFLTDERTFRRKITEFFMSLLVEARTSKEDILETYINLIYMGQNGPFQVRGFAAASDHYFNTDFKDLNLEQCALLAAIVNSPGMFDPFKNPDKARGRRARVLDRMSELHIITAEEAAAAKQAPLPSKSSRVLSEPAPYFVASARKQLADLAINLENGARVYTTLDVKAQEAAMQSVASGLANLEKTHPVVKKLAAAGKFLEASMLTADPQNGFVQAIVGGRKFLSSPFNRAVESHRQVGSIMKPLVYLTALESRTEKGEPYNALTKILDEKFTHKYEGQTWSPNNYDGTFNGEVPLYWALKESLNAATARLGLAIGLPAIIDLAKRVGVTSYLEPLPALTLGAFELYPWEVLQAYTTLSRMGSLVKLSFIAQVEDMNGGILFSHKPGPETRAAPETVAQLVGMMKQAFETGTARGSRKMGFTIPAAGKTGTTNDKKDAWFAGFTPEHVAVVWVGYDDNTPHQLTGASGAVPIWTQYMLAMRSRLSGHDFAWPEGTEAVTFSPERQRALGVPAADTAAPLQLVFKRGDAPAP